MSPEMQAFFAQFDALFPLVGAAQPQDLKPEISNAPQTPAAATKPVPTPPPPPPNETTTRGPLPPQAAPPVDVATGDAITQELQRVPRRTVAVAARTLPAMAQFQRDVVDGLIRVDAAHRVLALIDQVIGIALRIRA